MASSTKAEDGSKPEGVQTIPQRCFRDIANILFEHPEMFRQLLFCENRVFLVFLGETKCRRKLDAEAGIKLQLSLTTLIQVCVFIKMISINLISIIIISNHHHL